jgi:anti-sigma factor RsiW
MLDSSEGAPMSHPDEGTLQALIDGELGVAESMRIRWHIARCATCARELSQAGDRARSVASLLRAGAPPVNVAEGWARRRAHSGALLRGSGEPWRRWAAVFVIVAIGLLAGPIWRSRSRTPSADELFAMVRDARLHPDSSTLRDSCCGDHDGGDSDDDGVLTVSNHGQRVVLVVLYEDVDHSGTFTPGDIVRYVSVTRR